MGWDTISNTSATRITAAMGRCRVFQCKRVFCFSFSISSSVSEQNMSNPANRRDFLKVSSTGLLAAAALQVNSAAVAGKAQDKLIVALIGCGGRGIHDAGLFKNTPDVELAYVCDVDAERRAKAAQTLGVDSSRAVGDLRKVLEDSAVNAVIIATPDHWHSPAAIVACNAGKHVYVEKPISHNLREGRLLVEAAQRNKTLVQHGTQSRST